VTRRVVSIPNTRAVFARSAAKTVPVTMTARSSTGHAAATIWRKGEEAVGTMTSGEDQSERLSGGEVEEERGGPFVKTRGGDEFARGTDRSNPRDATREPFPRT
jgi:hypothetical protein